MKIKKSRYPLIIAELSANHNNSIIVAKKIINILSQSNIWAIKFQAFKPENMAPKLNIKKYQIKDKKNIWKGDSFFNLYTKAATPYDWLKKLYIYSKKKKITCFSSVFDEESLEFLESIKNPIYKIASFENTDLELIKKVSKTKKPLIISLGMTKLNEIYDAVETAKINGCRDLTLLKCTSSYPARNEELNLSTIADLKKRFKCRIGFSDHTSDHIAPVVATSMGAEMIEKHVKLDDGIGLDSKFSMKARDFKKLSKYCSIAKDSLGKIQYDLSKSEKKSVKNKRSLYFGKDLLKNTIIKKEHLLRLRPGRGLKIKLIKSVIGKKLTKSVKKFTPVKLPI
mgnify:CR=1 FL=1|jgi:pseudaminic acid synthase